MSRDRLVMLATALPIGMGAAAADRHAPLACYPPDASPGQWREIERRFGALPPGLLAGAPGARGDADAAALRSAGPQGREPDARFYAVDTAWTGEAALGPAGRGAPASLSFSFAIDGAFWGDPLFGTGPSELRALLGAQFGPANLDLGLELLRSCFGAWTSLTGARFFEVPDDGAPMIDPRNRAFHGDIRVGGLPYGDDTFLAYAYLPFGGGHATINTSYLLGNFGIPDNSFRFFRNMFTHELGHSLGLLHVTPCDGTKLMEPRLVLGVDSLSIDEIRAGQFSYGDRFAGNDAPSRAHGLGALDAPAPRAVVERLLSTVGPADGPASADWFRFSLGSRQPVRVAVTPRGGSYPNALQEEACIPSSAPTVNAFMAGNLRVHLFDASGTSLIAQSPPAPPGAVREIALTLDPGEYTFRVIDVGPNNPDDQLVQLYDLEAWAGATPALPPPFAFAGVDKVVRAGLRCFFLGDLNSRASNPAATLNPESFDWDLDGDGVFETLGAPRPMTIYTTNGVRTVTLRLTDSLGAVATHSVRVMVVGAVPTLRSISPAQAQRGTTTPITLVGVNLGLVLLPGQVSVGGAGVVVTGTPVPSPDGSRVTGLSLVVDAGAALGPRDVIAAAFNGTATAPGALVITDGPPCVADITGDGLVDFLDLVRLLTDYGAAGAPGMLRADLNRDGLVNHIDLSILLSAYGSACP